MWGLEERAGGRRRRKKFEEVLQERTERMVQGLQEREGSRRVEVRVRPRHGVNRLGLVPGRPPPLHTFFLQPAHSLV